MKRRYHGQEKRKCHRFKVMFPLEVCGDDFRCAAEIRDISCSGILCQSPRFIPLKTRLTVRMGLLLAENGKRTERAFCCDAEVTRIDPPRERPQGSYVLGIAFSGINTDDQQCILRFVRQRNIRDARELQKIYRELNAMMETLTTMEECHPTAEHFRAVIEKAIQELDSVAHLLECEITELERLKNDGLVA
jgi:hypothetical protein